MSRKAKTTRPRNKRFRSRAEFNRSFPKIYARLKSAVRFIGTKMHLSYEDREDILSESVRRAIRSYKRIPEDAGQVSYLNRIAYRAFIDYIKKIKHSIVPLMWDPRIAEYVLEGAYANTQSPDVCCSNQFLKRDIRAVLEHAAHECPLGTQIVKLRFFKKYMWKKVAAVTGYDMSKCKREYNRCLKFIASIAPRLREYL